MSERPSPATVLIGPANYAGQAEAFARALVADGIAAESAGLTVPGRDIQFPADIQIPVLRWALDPIWQRRWTSKIQSTYTHVVIDGGLPIAHGGIRLTRTGIRAGRARFEREARQFVRSGLNVAVLFHGSEIRDPDRHAQWEALSPFRSLPASELQNLRRVSRRTKGAAERLGRAAFVTTPDLLLDLPSATWLPTVVDPKAWPSARPLNLSRPVILHLPSNPAIAGTLGIDAVLRSLDDAGVVRYLRPASVSPSRMPQLIGSADIILDKCSIGAYGVIAIEAMMAGRLVLGHVHRDVRDAVARQFGQDVPVVDVDASSIAGVLKDITEHPEKYEGTAWRGSQYARMIHDGRESACIMEKRLGI